MRLISQRELRIVSGNQEAISQDIRTAAENDPSLNLTLNDEAIVDVLAKRLRQLDELVGKLAYSLREIKVGGERN